MPKPVPPALLNQAVLLFLKGLASPVVLYKEDCAAFYAELQQVLKLANPAHPKLIEKEGMGPLSRVSFLDTELVGVALQSTPPPGMG